MTALCLAVGAAVQAVLPVAAFTLAWTHSVEKVQWEEDWRIAGRTLVAEEARVRGSGAGMEPPPGSQLRDGVWHYRPAIGPLPSLRVTLSPFTADYSLCADGRCTPLSQVVKSTSRTEVVDISPCPHGTEKG